MIIFPLIKDRDGSDETVKEDRRAEICTYPNPRPEPRVVVPGSPPLGDPVLVKKVISDWTPQCV